MESSLPHYRSLSKVHFLRTLRKNIDVDNWYFLINEDKKEIQIDFSTLVFQMRWSELTWKSAFKIRALSEIETGEITPVQNAYFSQSPVFLYIYYKKKTNLVRWSCGNNNFVSRTYNTSQIQFAFNIVAKRKEGCAGKVRAFGVVSGIDEQCSNSRRGYLFSIWENTRCLPNVML